jgi:transcriptional regulator with XRE-family HTH domain
VQALFIGPLKMSVGKRIKEERERLNLSQTAFGDIGEMGKTTVQAWERGTASPNAAFLELAATFGVDVYYVITGQRLENIATTPNELAYLRACKRMPNEAARAAGREALVGILSSHGIKLYE